MNISKKRKNVLLVVEYYQLHDPVDRGIDQGHQKIHLLLTHYADLPLINNKINKFFFSQRSFHLFTSASGEPSAGIFVFNYFLYISLETSFDVLIP